ncbi:hypothetical protein GWI33_005424 [Rhynchophorus ferrugineus]|uniref:Uncharacterized protein n=1 Tax=Rhynchophorus ferrugineus TaxID=354439 RepID=A0A834MI02_RHYFE|nr:hypothetical protein GWI33_005424 [Rhynchophorus ferrugineus]
MYVRMIADKMNFLPSRIDRRAINNISTLFVNIRSSFEEFEIDTYVPRTSRIPILSERSLPNCTAKLNCYRRSRTGGKRRDAEKRTHAPTQTKRPAETCYKADGTMVLQLGRFAHRLACHWVPVRFTPTTPSPADLLLEAPSSACHPEPGRTEPMGRVPAITIEYISPGALKNPDTVPNTVYLGFLSVSVP